VEFARRDQREDVASGPGVIVGPIEQPGPASYSDGSEGALSGVVLHMRRLIPS
jgi:hypothetical protein